jgi:uncharacterized protein GlcG (DUF336 family)
MPAPAQLTKSIPMASISREAAAALIAACLAAAKEIGMEVAVAVTDATGSLRAFERTDGAPFLTTDVAIDKAWTASSYGYPTHVWNQYVGDPKVAPLAYHPRLLAVGGGYPIMGNGRLIGGVGISGGNAAQDQDAAEQGLKALGFDLTT